MKAGQAALLAHPAARTLHVLVGRGGEAIRTAAVLGMMEQQAVSALLEMVTLSVPHSARAPMLSALD